MRSLVRRRFCNRKSWKHTQISRRDNHFWICALFFIRCFSCIWKKEKIKISRNPVPVFSWCMCVCVFVFVWFSSAIDFLSFVVFFSSTLSIRIVAWWYLKRKQREIKHRCTFIRWKPCCSSTRTNGVVPDEWSDKTRNTYEGYSMKSLAIMIDGREIARLIFMQFHGRKEERVNSIEGFVKRWNRFDYALVTMNDRWISLYCIIANRFHCSFEFLHNKSFNVQILFNPTINRKFITSKDNVRTIDCILR